MAIKQANTAQKKWMSDITEWAEDNLGTLYGEEWQGAAIQRHHVLGRSAKHNKVEIGHWFILPVPFVMHDPNVDHEFHVGKCKRAFTDRFGTQSSIFQVMISFMDIEGYKVPSLDVYHAIMDTKI